MNEREQVRKDIYKNICYYCTCMYYAEILLDKKNYLLRILSVGILVLIVVALLYFKMWWPSAFVLLTSFIETSKGYIAKLFSFLSSDIKMLRKARKISEEFMLKYMDLFHNLNYKKITVDEAYKQNVSLMQKSVKSNTEMSEIFGETNKEINDLAKKKAENELTRKYYEKESSKAIQE